MSSLEGNEFPIPPEWKGTAAQYFWAYEQHSHPRPFPLFKPGDIVFSRYHGFIGNAIALLDLGKRGAWSHVSVYYGDGMVAESTAPRGGINPIAKWMDKKHSLEIWRVPDSVWAPHFKYRLTETAGQLVKGTPYDYLNIVRHLLDFVPAALFKFRPFERWVRDRDGMGRMVCSEAVGWSYFKVAGKPILPDIRAGQETPEELYCGVQDLLHGNLVFSHRKGTIQHIGWDVA